MGIRKLKITEFVKNDLKIFGFSEYDNLRIKSYKLSIWFITRIFRSLIISLTAIWAIPLVVFARFIAPIYRVRFGIFVSNRIGHFISDSLFQIIVQERSNPRTLDLWAVGKVINRPLLKIIKRDLNISSFFRPLYYWNSVLPGGQNNKVFPLKDSRDIDGLFTKYPIKVKFSKNESDFANDWLRNIGLNDEDKYICLLVRDSAFLQSNRNTSVNLFRNKKFFDYHTYRNSKIESYREGVDILLNKGYWVFRMGTIANEPMNITHPKFVDYPFLAKKSKLMDLWLFANCSGCISTGTGIDHLAWTQGIPSLILNYLPLKIAMTSFANITVPKKLFWEKSSMELKLSDYFLHSYFRTEDYSENGIIIRDLSSREISSAIEEFLEYMTSANRLSTQDHLFKDRFLEILVRQNSYGSLHKFVNDDFKLGLSWALSKHDSFWD